MAWVYLIIAGLLEVAWALGMKYSEGWTRLWPSVFTVACMIISFILLSKALKVLPVSVAYGVWVGIGAVGVAIAGMLMLGESAAPLKLVFIALICIGIIGLKISHV